MNKKNLPLKIVLSDMDGTLLSSDKKISSKTLDMIARLQAAHLTLCLASARSPAGMMRYIRQLNLKAVCAGFNGSIIFSPGGVIHRNITFSVRLMRDIINILLSYSVEIWLQNDEDWIVEDSTTDFVCHEYAATDVVPKQIKQILDYNRPVNRIMVMSTDSDTLNHLEDVLISRYKEQIIVASSCDFILDITAPAATKGQALKVIAEIYNVHPAQLVGLGDAPNDISLLQEAGIGIAMGQALQKVKNVADFVTESNDEEGWSNAIEKIVLPRVR